jgi:hypothetical protein
MQGIHFRSGFFDRFRAKLERNTAFAQDVAHLRPTDAGQVGGLSERDRLVLIPLDRKIDAQIGAIAKQMA